LESDLTRILRELGHNPSGRGTGVSPWYPGASQSQAPARVPSCARLCNPILFPIGFRTARESISKRLDITSLYMIALLPRKLGFRAGFRPEVNMKRHTLLSGQPEGPTLMCAWGVDLGAIPCQTNRWVMCYETVQCHHPS
jgi:hypothetical protein